MKHINVEFSLPVQEHEIGLRNMFFGFCHRFTHEFIQNLVNCGEMPDTLDQIKIAESARAAWDYYSVSVVRSWRECVACDSIIGIFIMPAVYAAQSVAIVQLSTSIYYDPEKNVESLAQYPQFGPGDRESIPRNSSERVETDHNYESLLEQFKEREAGGGETSRLLPEGKEYLAEIYMCFAMHLSILSADLIHEKTGAEVDADTLSVCLAAVSRNHFDTLIPSWDFLVEKLRSWEEYAPVTQGIEWLLKQQARDLRIEVYLVYKSLTEWDIA